MPKVVSSVKSNFSEGTQFGKGLLPDEAVAIGATTQAFLLQVRRSCNTALLESGMRLSCFSSSPIRR